MSASCYFYYEVGELNPSSLPEIFERSIHGPTLALSAAMEQKNTNEQKQHLTATNK